MFDVWEKMVDYLVYGLFGLDASTQKAEVVHFFIFDTVKIYILLVLIIFAVSFLRTYFNTDKVRVYLQGKSEFTGNVLAALFGIITPFCSCSAIPLFLGFMQARIPLGITFSFLISSPMNNEIAIALLFGLFGWKITALYIGFGLLVAILGGFTVGKLGMEKYVLIPVVPMSGDLEEVEIKLTVKKRVKESWDYTLDILQKIYLYVMIGVGIGAFIHGYVPTELIVKYAGSNAWYSVPFAVLLGVPMYSNAAGVMPLIEVLTSKGMLLGTALSFMMAITALSLPEAMILKRILHVKLIALFFGIVALGIMGVGYLFNALL
ncbi:permease [Sulfurospirillum diekertiae]|uniref:Two-component membrane permease complex subunit SMU_747c n=1 Tax=Sulfurospirillum diekertiae TaxID=1854492 RepID=A0A1Y0HPH1_9BACT|nr:permease [Sulfurospirillum diekertiae]ARU50017.1 Putative two-component membrane permease complex subunit SMU_747c [Sulfurospirillum diekertiae]ASC94805.1 Putative two-component membrane permease complex subunit [Sulfurospirillum diekertiae]